MMVFMVLFIQSMILCITIPLFYQLKQLKTNASLIKMIVVFTKLILQVLHLNLPEQM